MKILFIRPSRRLSGAEKYNIYLLKELKKYAHVLLLTNLKDFQNTGIPIKIAAWLPDEIGTKKQLLRTLLFSPIFIFRYIFESIYFDIICLESRTEMIFLTPVLTLFGKKTVWVQHGPLFVPGSSSLINYLYCWASFFVTKIIAVSKNTKQNLLGGGIAKEKVDCIYIGINVPEVKKFRKPNVVGFLGTITIEKGIDEFLRIVTLSKKKAVVIGDGPDRHLIPHSIECTGFVKNSEKYLSKVGVLFMPTRHYEGISLAFLESMALGIPVITTDIGGNREVVRNNFNGLLIKPGDSVRWNHNWGKMGKNAHAFVEENFNIKIQVKDFVAFFQTLSA